MFTKVGKWGNSLGVILPIAALRNAKIKEGDRLEVRVDGDTITLRAELGFSAMKDRTIESMGQLIALLEDAKNTGDLEKVNQAKTILHEVQKNMIESLDYTNPGAPEKMKAHYERLDRVNAAVKTLDSDKVKELRAPVKAAELALTRRDQSIPLTGEMAQELIGNLCEAENTFMDQIEALLVSAKPAGH